MENRQYTGYERTLALLGIDSKEAGPAILHSTYVVYLKDSKDLGYPGALQVPGSYFHRSRLN